MCIRDRLPSKTSRPERNNPAPLPKCPDWFDKILFVQVDADAGIEKCMDIMGKHRVRHLPVVEKRKVVGVITSTDLLILTVNEKNIIIEQLERYISPSGY